MVDVGFEPATQNTYVLWTTPFVEFFFFFDSPA